jgi:hypothetical protein
MKIIPTSVKQNFGGLGRIVADRPEQRVNAGKTDFVGHTVGLLLSFWLRRKSGADGTVGA